MMNVIKHVFFMLLSVFVLLTGCQKNQINTIESISEDINCPGNYGGHQQGMATDGKDAIFWSHTTQLVKTDMNGDLLKVVDVPRHHGDLDYYNQKVYVAVSLAGMNGSSPADSWIYAYDAEDLSLISKHAVPEVVFGAGGIAINDGRFMVVGGLPGDYKENYVYEYDSNFKFIKRHTIKSGHTAVGIQTAAWFDGCWWFGCYGLPNNPGLLKTDDSFNLISTYDINFGFGIIGIKNDKFLRGGETGEAIITCLRP